MQINFSMNIEKDKEYEKIIEDNMDLNTIQIHFNKNYIKNNKHLQIKFQEFISLVKEQLPKMRMNQIKNILLNDKNICILLEESKNILLNKFQSQNN